MLTTDDVRNAADLFADLHASSDGFDGRVSIEMSTRAWRIRPRRPSSRWIFLHEVVGRENVMIKIPATEEGMLAITAVIAKGISVNVTSIFSVATATRL